MCKKITVKGVEYPTLRAAAAAFGIRADTARARLERGAPADDAFAPVEPRPSAPPRRPPSITKTEVAGVEYPSRAAAARAYGVDRMVFNARLHCGWTLEEALEIVPRVNQRQKVRSELEHLAAQHGLPLRALKDCYLAGARGEQLLVQAAAVRPKCITITGKAVEVRGVRYPSQAAAAKAHGVAPGTLQARLKYGWALEAALGLAPHAKKQPSIVINGVSYASVKDAVRRTGTNPSTFYLRIKQGLSVEEALAGPKRKPSVPVSVAGETFPSLADAAKHYKIARATVSDRLRWGWTLEQALTKPVRKTGRKTVRKTGMSFNGRKLKTLKDAVTNAGLNEGAVYGRLSLKDALLSSKALAEKKLAAQKNDAAP